MAEGGGWSGAAKPRGGVRFSGGSGGDRTSVSLSTSSFSMPPRSRLFFFFFRIFSFLCNGGGLGAFSRGINIGGGRIFFPSNMPIIKTLQIDIWLVKIHYYNY